MSLQSLTKDERLRLHMESLIAMEQDLEVAKNNYNFSDGEIESIRYALRVLIAQYRGLKYREFNRSVEVKKEGFRLLRKNTSMRWVIGRN